MANALHGALVLVAVCRPRVRGYRRTDWLLIGGFGAALAGMNTLAYHAIALIPLGPVVMLEVLGPLVLAVVTARRAASWLWAGLATAGVALLSSTGFDRLTPAGIGFAAGAGAVWAGYIMASARVGQRFPKADGLALAMTAAAISTLPFGAGTAGTTLLNPGILAMGVAVALLSSALPYTLELLALRRMPTTTFAVLMSLGPAVAAIAGYVVLHQRLTPIEGLAIALVIAADIGAREVRRTSSHPVAACRGSFGAGPAGCQATAPARGDRPRTGVVPARIRNSDPGP
jgi:inner membrane transporter RhtA